MLTLDASRAHDAGGLTGHIGVFSTPAADIYLTVGARKRVVSARLFWNGGPASERIDRAGLHALAMAAVLRSRSGAAGETLADRLESAGVFAESGVTASSCYLGLRGPREYLRLALPAVVSQLRRTAIDDQECATALAIVRNDIERRKHDVKSVAIDCLRKARFEPGARLAAPAVGTRDGVEAATAREVNATVGRLLHDVRLRVLIAGDDDQDEYAGVGQIRDSGALAGDPAPWASLSDLVTAPPATVAVPSQMRDQAHLLWGVVTPIDGPLDYTALELGLHVLGGWAGSRWHLLFRERLGYSYGTYSGAEAIGLGDRAVCLGYVGFSVATDALPHVRELVDEEAAAFIGSLHAAELMSASAQLLRAEALVLDSARGLIGRAADFLSGALPPSFWADRVAALRRADIDDILGRLEYLMNKPTLVVVSQEAA